MNQLELLAPARDLQIGIAAIDCGADAVYIAGPRFGARQAAGNTLDDIARTAEYAHRYGVRLHCTLNTLLFEDELRDAERMARELIAAGADALGEDCAVYANVIEPRYVEPEKEWAVGSFTHTLAVAKIVFPGCSVIHHLYFKLPLGGLVIANLGFVAIVLSTCYGAGEQRVVLFVDDVEL